MEGNIVSSKNTEPKISFMQKVGYGLGDSGSSFAWTFTGAFALIYFTDTLGLSAATVGVLIAISRLLDGFSDILMGIVIDRTKHKMGKTRFWQFSMSFPLAASVFLLFNVPGFFSDTGKYVYIFIVYTLLSVFFYTMVNVAYSTMVAYVTKDRSTQVSLYSFRFILATIASVSISSITMNLVEQFGGGQTGWFWVSVIYSILSIVFLNAPVIALRELPESELLEIDQGKKNKQKESVGFLDTFKVLLKNRYFVYTFIRGILLGTGPGILAATGIYYATYVLNNSAMFGVLAALMGLPMMILLPFMGKISKKMSLASIGMAATGLGAIGGLIMLFSGGNIMIVFLGLGICGVALGPISSIGGAFKAEIADYSILKYGKDVTGAIFSSNTVSGKVGAGLGTVFLGFVLEWSGYIGGASEQSASTVKAIQYLYTSPMFITMILALLLFFITPVERVNKKLRAEKKEEINTSEISQE